MFGLKNNVVRDFSLEEDFQTAKELAFEGRGLEALNLLDATEFSKIVQVSKSPERLKLLNPVDLRYFAVFCHTRASILTYLHDDSAAIEWYQWAIAAQPGDSEPWADQAGCHYRLGELALAAQCAKTATGLNQKDELAWEWWAKSLCDMGDYPQALDVVEQGLGMLKDSRSLLFQKASILARSGRLREAIELMQSILRIDPNDGSAWFNQGVYLGLIGDHHSACDAFRHAVNIAPTNGDVWRNYAVTLGVLGNLQEAEKAAKTALGLFPGDSVSTMVLSNIYYQKGDQQKSLATIDKALRVNPTSQELLDLRERFSKG